jgi:hypothetical protein
MEKLKALVAEYGRPAIVVFVTLYVLTLGAILALIAGGFRPESMTGGAGVFVASYALFKLTMPVRIAATLLLTPLVARLWKRVRRPKGDSSEPPA